MRLLEELNKHIPYNEEEKMEVESFKQSLMAFGDKLYSRDNLPAHVATVVWVVNPQRTKTLMGYHNLFKTFTWFGGHADEDDDLLNVCKKELEEETGIKNFKILNNGEPFDFVVLRVDRHVKKGVFVPEHLHYSCAYLFEVSEEEEFRIAEEENSAIKWVYNQDILKIVSEDRVVPVYARLIDKVKNNYSLRS